VVVQVPVVAVQAVLEARAVAVPVARAQVAGVRVAQAQVQAVPVAQAASHRP